MSFAAESHPRSTPGVPLAAMVDMLFLLLVFFMTASAFRETDRQIHVALPPAQTNQTGVMTRAPVVISVKADGSIYLGDRVHTLTSMRDALQRLAQDYPEERVLIRSDQDSPFGVTFQVMDSAYLAGLENVSFAGSEPDRSDE